VALAGCLAGVAASLAASRYVAALLYGTSPRSPPVLAASLAALASIAAIASLIPALRASRIDPIAAIRYE
jgi:ABC-type antimicrobial peptide transport system permease subunit